MVVFMKIILSTQWFRHFLQLIEITSFSCHLDRRERSLSDVEIIEDPSHTFGMTRTTVRSIDIPILM
jgi:hypothetical protein